MLRLFTLPCLSAYLGVVSTAAIFGLFSAWICTTMWGLDNADPRIAMDAMQHMNASVRNAVFFPIFFLTPAFLVFASIVLWRNGSKGSGRLFLAAAVIYFFGGLLLTLSVNVPMNLELAAKPVPQSLDAARLIWTDYSGQWQFWNVVRTVASGVSLLLAGIGVAAMSNKECRQAHPA